MIKVIRNARARVDVTRRFMCNVCKSTLEASPADATGRSSDRDGEAFVFRCPVCKGDVWIDAKLFEAGT